MLLVIGARLLVRRFVATLRVSVAKDTWIVVVRMIGGCLHADCD